MDENVRFLPDFAKSGKIGQKRHICIHNFWYIQPEDKINTIFGIYRPFPFIWDPIWLPSDKIEKKLYIAGCWNERFLSILLQGNHKESTKTTMIFGFSSPKIGNLGECIIIFGKKVISPPPPNNRKLYNLFGNRIESLLISLYIIGEGESEVFLSKIKANKKWWPLPEVPWPTYRRSWRYPGVKKQIIYQTI